MSTLTIPRNYNDTEVLDEQDLDDAFDAIETKANTTKWDADNIADSAITTAKINNLAVTDAKLAADAVTTVKIADDAVTGAKLDTTVADGTTLELNSNTLRIKDSGVSTAKIAATAVTRAKLEALGQQVSSSGSDTESGVTYVDASNLTISITTTGRPVFVGMISDGTTTSYVGASTTTQQNSLSAYKILRGATTVSFSLVMLQITDPVSAESQIRIPPGCIWHIDAPAAGTYTYKVQFAAGALGSTAVVEACKLVAYEL